jgi:hypothetical protein
MTVVEQAIENGRGDHVVAKDLAISPKIREKSAVAAGRS